MHTAPAMRERLFTMRMSNEEWERADRLASHYGLNLAGLIRMVLKERERDLGLTPPPSPAPLPTPARTKTAKKK